MTSILRIGQTIFIGGCGYDVIEYGPDCAERICVGDEIFGVRPIVTTYLSKPIGVSKSPPRPHYLKRKKGRS